MRTIVFTLGFTLVCVFSHSYGLDCGDGIIRGVNLGGWLLLEPWITPTVFEEVNEPGESKIVDEYTYAQYVDPAFYTYRLTKHWDEYLTRDNLVKLNAAGISHVRIPVGYWMFDVTDDEPFPPPPQTDDEGLRFFLKRGVTWCDEIGIKVLLDMHGAPGSQNGFDNSGRRGDVHWFDPASHDNVDRTIRINNMMAEMILGWIEEGSIKAETFYGLELLNEPKGGDNDPLWYECRDTFYPDSYDALREIMDEDFAVVVQQAFRNPEDFINYMPEEDGFFNVAVDMHEYHGFGKYWNDIAPLPNAWDLNLEGACNYTNVMLEATLPSFVGEWSLATTDCQKYVDQGYNDPYVPPNGPVDLCESYYTSDFDSYSEDHKEKLKTFMRAQLDSYEAGAGYFFWTFKTENNCAPEWDLLFLLENGIAPPNLCEHERYCPSKTN